MSPPKSISDPFSSAEICFNDDPTGALDLVEAGDMISIDGAEMPVDFFVESGDFDFPGTSYHQRLNKVFGLAMAAHPGTSIGVSEDMQIFENDLRADGFSPSHDEMGQLRFVKRSLAFNFPGFDGYNIIPDDIFGFSLSEYLVRHDIRLDGDYLRTFDSGRYWPRQGIETLDDDAIRKAQQHNRKIQIKLP